MNDRPEPFDPATGEILQTGVMRAADGGVIPAAATTLGDALNMLEDGRFGAEALHKMQQLGKLLADRSAITEKAVKGSITIKLEMTAEDDMFKITPEITVKEPKIARPRSPMWQDPDTGTFTRFPAKQMQMFGLNPGAAEPRAVRNVG